MPIPVTGQSGQTPTPPSVDGGVAAAEAERLRREREHNIDEELEQSFPASDPPSWTMGVTPGNRSDTRQERVRGATEEAPSPPAAH
jgi:hypothetical protein